MHQPEVRSVVLVTAVVTEPRDAGKKVVLAGMIDYWIGRVGVDGVHVVLVDEAGADSSRMPVRVHPVVRPSAAEQARSVLVRSLGRRHSLQESVLYAPRVRRELADVLARLSADLEIYDTVRMAQYADEIEAAPHTRRIVYLDDLFGVRYARMLELLQRHPDVDLDPLGQFRRHLPGPVARVADRPAARRALLGWEQRAVSRRERQVAAQFGTSLLISPTEVATLQRDVPSARVKPFPPVLDVAAVPRGAAGPPVFVLMGLLELAHNLDAVRAFLDTCLDDLLRAVPDARIHIVGRGAPPSLVDRVANLPGCVTIDGFVPDLRELLGRTTAILAPLRFGSGIKIKIIEALAHGVPVVATPVGCEGIVSGPDEGIIVVPRLEDFVPAVVSTTDPQTNARLARAARRTFERHYSRAAAYAAYDEAFAP